MVCFCGARLSVTVRLGDVSLNGALFGGVWTERSLVSDWVGRPW